VSALRNKYITSPILLTVAAIWGSAFVIMKTTLERLDVNSFLATRFIIATIFLIAINPKTLKKMNRTFLLKGVIAGALLGSGYILQTFGLTLTTVAKTGFITGLYAVFTPLIAAFVLRKRILGIQWIAVAIATIGLALLSFKGISIGLGEFLVLLSALFFALHIIALGEWSPTMDTYAFTVVQMGTVGIISLLCSFKSGFHLPADGDAWFAIIYTAILASAFAFMVMTWGQTFMEATTIGIILTSEYIFAAIFAAIFAKEHLTSRTLIGGALVMGAMYLLIWVDGRPKNEKIAA
jgi:drug/metabolite transporter (DMT)-like permease